MRVEVGCGRNKSSGYKTIDIEVYAKPDYLGDFRTMTFSDLEEIKCEHLLEHFGREESTKVLKQWRSWLKLGGILNVVTPDLERLCWIFANQPFRLWAPRELINKALYGSQEVEWAYHRDGWWEDKFKEVLPQVGFKIISVQHAHNLVRLSGSNVRYRLPNIKVLAEAI